VGLFDLDGHVAVVTGGNSGIGLGMAGGLAGAGAQVIIWGTSPERNEAAVARLRAHRTVASMTAMKPRTGDGPLEVTKEGRGIVMRVPLEGGGRLVVELTADEAARLGDALKTVVPQG
jgi:NAD(P)-dependent dehydrogenase (short-subunit alcohol dehydrogenase family)